MSLKRYNFRISGTGAGGANWSVEGSFVCDFIHAFDTAMNQTFDALTAGRAIYGSPGKGCDGPYDILQVILEQVRPN